MNEDYLLDLVYDLFEEEKKLEVAENYYDTVQEKEISPKMRTKLVEWMIQLADEIKLGYKTKQMAIIIIDIILSKLKIHKKYLQLLGITTIFIVVKAEESFIYNLTHACDHCANAYTREEVSAMEMLILKTLKWKLQFPTPGEIARRLVQLANQALGVNLPKFFKKIDNFIDLIISDYDISLFSPTAIACAAVMCAFENSLAHVELWRKLMIEHFQLDFENRIDILYQNVIQKLLKFYPEYFSFPVTQDNSLGYSDENTTIATENGYQDSGMTLSQNDGPDSGMSMMSQENYMHNGHQGNILLENAQYYGAPTGVVNSGMEEETY